MKYLYSIFIILCSHIVFSQDLQYTIDYLNKIYEEERIFFDSKNHYSEDFAPGNGYNEIIYIDSIVPRDTRCKYLDRKYEKQVLDYLEKFMYDSLPNIRKITYEFIYSVGNYSKKKKIRQRAVYMLLEMAVSPLVDRDNIIRFNKEDFNKKAKERLKDIIRGKKTQAEIDFFVNYEMRELLSNKFLDNQVEYICKKDSLPYELVRDSIYEHTRKKEIKYVIDWVPGHRLIELAGKIYMYDFVPELKEMLDDKRYSGEQCSDIKYALARMGDTIIEKQLLKSSSFFRYEYINTQRALEKLIKEFYTDETHDCYGNGWLIVPRANFIHLRLQDWILNFPEELKIDNFACNFTNAELKKVEKAKIWIKENKGKYELNKSVW